MRPSTGTGTGFSVLLSPGSPILQYFYRHDDDLDLQVTGAAVDDSVPSV